MMKSKMSCYSKHVERVREAQPGPAQRPRPAEPITRDRFKTGNSSLLNKTDAKNRSFCSVFKGSHVFRFGLDLYFFTPPMTLMNRAGYGRCGARFM
jgi:hypothetical protein